MNKNVITTERIPIGTAQIKNQRIDCSTRKRGNTTPTKTANIYIKKILRKNVSQLSAPP